jgi:hypothetical protein
MPLVPLPDIPQEVSAAFQSKPDVAINASGDFVVTWTDFSTQQIKARRYNNKGTPVSDEFIVAGAQQSAPSISSDAAGDFVIAWERSGQDPAIFGRRYNEIGEPLDDPFRVYPPIILFAPGMSSDFTDPIGGIAGGPPSVPFGARVSSDSAGNFVVVWRISPFGQLDARRYASSGEALGTAFQINNAHSSYAFDADVAAYNNGAFVVVWSDYSNYGVRAARYDNTGAPVGSEIPVALPPDAGPLSVGSDYSGNFVVAWQQYESGEAEYGIFARRFSNAGEAEGSEFHVNAYTTGSQVRPSVSRHGGSGAFVVVWQDSGCTFGEPPPCGSREGDGAGIFGRRFDAAGVPIGTEFQVNTYTTNDQTNPRVAADEAGHFVVVWESYGQDSDQQGVFGQLYIVPGAVCGNGIIELGEQCDPPDDIICDSNCQLFTL